MYYAHPRSDKVQGRLMTHDGATAQMPTKAATEPARTPTHQQVYGELRARVLFGDFAPGLPLTIQGLVAETGAGMTPVREGLVVESAG